MMSFAYVFVHKQTQNNSHQVVRTDSIKQFDIDKFVCEKKSTRSAELYSLKNGDGSYSVCQVLAIADDAVAIETISNDKRISVPKLSKTLINQFQDDSELSSGGEASSSDSATEKKRRKNLKKYKTSSLSGAEQAIASKYSKNRIIVDSCESDNEVDPLMLPKSKKRKTTTTTDIVHAHIEESFKNDDPIFVSTPMRGYPTKGQPFGNLSPLNTSDYQDSIINHQHDTTSLKSQLMTAEAEAKQWKDKYDALIQSKAYPLTEATGQKIVHLLKQLEQASPPSVDFDDKTNNCNLKSDNGSKKSVTKDDARVKTSLKSNKSVDDSDSPREEEEPVFKFIMENKFKDAAECAKTIVKSFWTQEELLNRIVRPTKSSEKKVLTPKKVDHAKSLFNRWLKQKGYNKDARAMESSNFNSYVGRAIGNAVKNNTNKLKNASKKPNELEHNE